MHVLVAAARTDRVDDYSHTVEGELVHVPLLDCSTPDCGCTRGFAGLASHRPTTTVSVSDLDLDRAAYREAIRASMAAGGWCVPGTELAEETDTSWFEWFVDMHVEVAAQFPVGTILEREGEYVTVRRSAHAR